MSCTTGGTRSARAGCVSSVRPGHAGGGGDHRHKQGPVRPATGAAGPSKNQLKERAHGESFGQLVALGFGVAAFTPAPYQRHRL